MLTKQEYYGRAIQHHFTAVALNLVMEPHTEIRVWILTSDDFAIVPLSVFLPEAGSMRQEGAIIFMIYNDTTVGPVDIVDNIGAGVVSIDQQEAVILTLISKTDPNEFQGTWESIRYDGSIVQEQPTTLTVNFGGDGTEVAKCETYSYEADAWTVKTTLPLPSGSPFSVSASQYINPGGITKAFFGYDTNFFRWDDGTSVVRATPPILMVHSGLTWLRNFSGDFLLIGGGVTSTSVYTAISDSWAAGPVLPATIFPDEVVAKSGGIDAPPGRDFNYINPGSPDSMTSFIRFDQQSSTYSGVRLPVWPFGHFATSMVGIKGSIHWQNGGFSDGSTPGQSSEKHFVYNEITDIWAELPSSPLVARGVGIRDTSLYRDRYTFGMGAGEGYPGTPLEQHWQYNLFSQTYIVRAAFSWGTRDRRENAWARTVNSI